MSKLSSLLRNSPTMHLTFAASPLKAGSVWSLICVALFHVPEMKALKWEQRYWLYNFWGTKLRLKWRLRSNRWVPHHRVNSSWTHHWCCGETHPLWGLLVPPLFMLTHPKWYISEIDIWVNSHGCRLVVNSFHKLPTSWSMTCRFWITWDHLVKCICGWDVFWIDSVFWC